MVPFYKAPHHGALIESFTFPVDALGRALVFRKENHRHASPLRVMQGAAYLEDAKLGMDGNRLRFTGSHKSAVGGAHGNEFIKAKDTFRRWFSLSLISRKSFKQRHVIYARIKEHEWYREVIHDFNHGFNGGVIFHDDTPFLNSLHNNYFL
jgi:hypothetical protein